MSYSILVTVMESGVPVAGVEVEVRLPTWTAEAVGRWINAMVDFDGSYVGISRAPNGMVMLSRIYWKQPNPKPREDHVGTADEIAVRLNGLGVPAPHLFEIKRPDGSRVWWY